MDNTLIFLVYNLLFLFVLLSVTLSVTYNSAHKGLL